MSKISLTQWISLGTLAATLGATLLPLRTPQSTRAASPAPILVYYHSVISANTDLEAFARISEFAAQTGSTRAYLDEMSSLIMGVRSSLWGIPAGPLGRLQLKLKEHFGLTEGYPAYFRFGGSGFRFNDHSNQVQHFWFSVILAYHFGAGLADLAARYHEWNAPGLLHNLPGTGKGSGSVDDLALSRQGIRLGCALAEGQMKPAQVAEWVRENL